MTENDDAGYGFADYSLIATETSFMYIFLDDRYLGGGMPNWMRDLGFMDTDLDVYLDDGATSLPFSIYQANLPGGQPLSLYGLAEPNADFYGIVVSSELLIPEPTTLSLLGLGCLLALRRRRRK
jgi:hypothetical protein